MGNEVFISYRRDDGAFATDAIYKELVGRYGKDTIFKDIDNLKPGEDFRMVLNQALNTCKVALVVIGSRWLDAKDQQGQRRLDDPHDFVRIEIETLLSRDIPVIPILLDNVDLSSFTNLPATIAAIKNRQAQVVRPSDISRDVAQIAAAVGPYTRGRSPANRGSSGRRAPTTRDRILGFVIGALMGVFVGGILSFILGIFIALIYFNDPNGAAFNAILRTAVSIGAPLGVVIGGSIGGTLGYSGMN